MTIKELIKSASYKKIFNCIYKNYLVKRDREYNKTSIQNIDVMFYDLYKKFERAKLSTTPTDRVLKIRGIDSNVVDIYIQELDGKNHSTLEFEEIDYIANISIDNYLKISNEDLLCHIFWDIATHKHILE